VEATSEELHAWLGKESGKPVHVTTDARGLAAEPKRALSFIRSEKQSGAEKKQSAKYR
jgi:hypothetical protein